MDSSSNQTQTSKDKSWLIRTTQRQILGPVSKDKIISFLEKGALAPEDELASGNGYWFSVKEKDLVEKYLLGDIPQSFNPISEAPSVLTAPHDQREGTASLHPNPLPQKAPTPPVAVEEGTVLPAQDDLEYPDMSLSSSEDFSFSDQEELENEKEDITTVLKLEKPVHEEKRRPAPQEENRSALIAEVDEEIHLPDQDDLEYPDMGDFAPPHPAQTSSGEDKVEDEVLDFTKDDLSDAKPSKPQGFEPSLKKKGQKRKKKVIEAPQRNDRYLFYLLGLLILLTIGIFYYYKKVLNKPFPIIGSISSLVIPVVEAQTLSPDPLAIKKKDFLI